MSNPSNESDWLAWLRRILAGDADAEAELVSRYKKGIAIIINRVVHNESIVEDLSQETFRIALEKIREGRVREPERLSGFICGIARNLAVQNVRRKPQLNDHMESSQAEQIRDSQPDQFEQLWHKQRAEIVRQLISDLKVERDRKILIRYFIAEEDKEQICADLRLTSLQFNTVLNRALKRFKELYIKRFGDL